MRLLAFFVLLAQAGLGTSVPRQPDFSGRWTLVVALPSDADVPKTVTVRQSIRRTNMRGEPMEPFYDRIVIDREFAGGTTFDTSEIGIVGGTVSGTRAAPTRRTHRAVVVGPGPFRDSRIRARRVRR